MKSIEITEATFKSNFINYQAKRATIIQISSEEYFDIKRKTFVQ